MNAAAASPARKYDVVLYGATGFVGRQTVAYFASNAQVRASGLRWALGGRNRERRVSKWRNMTARDQGP